MRLTRLLVIFLTLLTSFSGKLLAQFNGGLPPNVFTLDSLNGFDLDLAKQNALSEGYFGKDFVKAMNHYKRQFVINKYDLYAKYNDPQNYNTSFGSSGKYSSGVTANAPCVNEGFESGTLAGWTASTGINSGSQNYPITPTSISAGSEVTVVTTPLVDPYVGAIPNSPLGGTKVVKVNNSSVGAVVVKLSQTFSVTPTNYLFDFAYWAVMETPTNAHNCNGTPYMLVKIRDNFGILQTCPNFSIVAPSGGGGCIGTGTTWQSVAALGTTVGTSTSWQTASIDLSPYLTTPYSNVTIELSVADCSLTGHFGYAYFDSNCNTMNLTVNSQTLSMPSPTVSPQVLCGSTATLTAPAGLGPYLWNGPVGSGITTNTNQTIVTAVPGNYSLTMSPQGVCNPISKIVALQFVPPTTFSASPANLCASGSNTASTLSASGAAQYTWMPGGSNASNIVVTPTVTTVYTLTARTGTCTGTYTLQVTVNPDPVVNVLSSNSSLCPGQTATMTAFGANSYVWNPGALSGSMVTVSQAAATTYTTIGTSTAGCTGSVTTTISQSPAPLVGILVFSPAGAATGSVCSGTPVTLIATGASIVWQPGGSTNAITVFTPTVTTTYTAIGSSGSCTASAVQTISVDPGPGIALSANPISTCPGNTTTLSAVAPAAVGAFTWNPGAINASSIVVTPTLAGGYSVSATNSAGCVNTQTINPTLSPQPTVVISPSSASVCAGSSTTLTASGALNYTWMPGNLTGASAVLSPTVNTTYTVTGANAAGCSNQTTVSITVVSIPTINASASPTAVCVGSCATITPSGASTYTISGGTFVVCPTSNTVYSIVGSNAVGCVSSPINVTVNVNPTPIIGASSSPTAICPAGSSTLTASGGVSYTWQPGGMNGTPVTVSPLATTVYTLTGASASGCTATANTTVVVNSVPVVSITPTSTSICQGSSVNLTASGAATYTWLPGNLSGSSVLVSPTVNTTYTVLGANGSCSGQNTVQVSVTPIPTISAAYSPTSICAGSCATLSPSGASTYTVLGLSTIACPTISSSYTVIGTDASGCVSAPIFGTLPVTPAPNITASSSPTAICPGGSSTLTAGGGTSYTWQPGGMNGTPVTVSPLATTVYTLTGASASGCTATANTTVLVNSVPVVSVTPSATNICVGSSVNLTASGAATYTWLPGNLSGSSVLVSPTVNTTYTVIGANGSCSGQNSVQVTVSPIPTISASSSPTAICAGSCATITPSGASTYTIAGGSFVVCPVVNTFYSITGTSASGCVSSPINFTVIVNSAPNITASSNPTVICPGGTSTLSAGGAASYTWQPGALTGANVSVNPAITTIYTVTGLGAFGCTATANSTVVVNSVPVISVSPSPTSICQGSSVNLTASGAATYTWLPGNLSGGNVLVSPTVNTTYTVLGANGSCSGQNTVQVFVTPIPTISAAYSPTAICAGSCATLNPSGASTYTVLGLSTVACPTITSSYTVIGTDVAGCVSAPIVGTLPVNSAPNIIASASPNSICQGNTSNLSASGAVSYIWQPGNLSGSAVTVTPAVSTAYTVTGTNASGCTMTTVVNVSVTPAPAVSAAANPTSACAGGVVTLSGSGATNYLWSPGGLSGANVFVNPTSTTTYTLIGTNGICSGTTTVNVVVNPSPTISVSASNTLICPGTTVSLSLSGATTYSWSDGSGAVSRIETPSVTTTYSAVGFSSSGCISNLVFITINVSSAPLLTASASPSVLCGSSISSTLTASGATNYTWTPGFGTGSSVVVIPVTSTVYTVTGSNGICSSTQTVAVTVNPGISLSAIASSSTVCLGSSANLSASGATNYTWTPGPLPNSANVVVTPTSSTVYTVIGEAGGCTGQATVAVNVITAPTIAISASSTSVCAGSCATLNASGASSYTWSTGFTGATAVVCPTVTTSYTVIGSIGSCIGAANITIFSVPSPTVSISSSANPICAGSNAILTGSGASNYLWSTSATSSTISVAPSTTSVYTLFGSIGSCTSTATFTLNVNPSSPITITPTSPTICAGFTVGLLATGSSASYTWQPNNVSINPLIDTPLASTVYTVSSNNGGCTASATIAIVVVPLPNVSLNANPSTICTGNTTTLTASGALTYSWIPGLQGGNTFTDNPSSTTVYTVVGFNAAGCPNYTTVTVNVVPGLSVLASSSNSSICFGGSTNLTASGAVNYTWLPSGQTTSSITVTPNSTITYTLIGNNGAGCSGSTTIVIKVNQSPTITAIASPTSVCAGNNVSLTASGATNYTWVPSGLIGANVTDNPLTSTTYTVFGVDANGCNNVAIVSVSVNSMSNILFSASPASLCLGGSSTLTASGGLSYTWNPGGQTTNSVVVTPTVTTTYTLNASDASGCTGLFTLPVNVFPTPTINISPQNFSICLGSALTLTATGATNYTWLPSATIGSLDVVTPTAQTTYTVRGDNGGLCFASATVNVFVNPLPSNVGASSIGTVGCTSPTAQLFGTCTDTNVSYSWIGAQGYTSTVQNPTLTSVWGMFTLTVTDNVTGCTATATVNVPSDNTIPFITPVASGSISCSVSTVTLNAVNTTTNPSYSWTGPGGFTSTIQTPTVSVQGTYTITVVDLSSTCSATAVVIVGTHTTVSITASITPSGCDSVGNSKNDGMISVLGFTLSDKFDVVSGTSYTGTATYITAATIPTNGILAFGLNNPSSPIAYTIRLFDSQGCTKDTTLFLVPVDCAFRTLGIAKAVSAPELNSDGSYNLTYTVVAKSYDLGRLSDIVLTENLSNTFPAPTSFTVIADSLKIIAGAQLGLNTSFNGSSQTNLLASGNANNYLESLDSTVIQFKIKVRTSLFLYYFNNSVIGQAVTEENVTMIDSSNTGLNPDPDGDNNPYNNNLPTSIDFIPRMSFGITKVGEIHAVSRTEFDVTYTITVHNLGNDTLTSIVLKDSLFNNTIKNPATYSMKSAPISSGGGLVANSSYDGNLNINLVNSAESKMYPNSVSSIYFTISLIPGETTSISNRAYGSGTSLYKDPSVLSDTSNAGTNPDINGNDIYNEASDNVPTVLLIPNTHTLFIPEGFSPDGDNINDYFVIQGLSTDGTNPITIYNRWGNKVYQNGNYDNTWDGTPNVSGTLGKNKLPIGTYYYILEMKGSGQKPITGFVVLQY